MRHKILVPLLLVVVSFMLVAAGLWGLRQYVEHERVEAVATALRSLIEMETNSLSESYFVWDAMYHAAEAGDLETNTRAKARLAALYARLGRLDEAWTLASAAESQGRKMTYQRG
ncbi:MAG: hypothetical protein WHT81_09155, partial [Rectinemataceae bacterium]